MTSILVYMRFLIHPRTKWAFDCSDFLFWPKQHHNMTDPHSAVKGLKTRETHQERGIDHAVSWAFWIAKELPIGTISRKWVSNFVKGPKRWVCRNWKKNFRGHPFRTSGLPGGGGVLENRTSIVISKGILLLNPDWRERGGVWKSQFSPDVLYGCPLTWSGVL